MSDLWNCCSNVRTFIHCVKVFALIFILYYLAVVIKSLTEMWETWELVLIRKLVEKVLINILSSKVYYITQNQPLCNQHNYQCACRNYAHKQINLTSIFVTTAALLCQHLIINNRTCTIIQTLLLFGTFTESFKKTNKTKLMLSKPLFIVHVRVKSIFKVIRAAVQKWIDSVAQVGMTKWDFINAKFQVSVQIKEVQ